MSEASLASSTSSSGKRAGRRRKNRPSSAAIQRGKMSSLNRSRGDRRQRPKSALGAVGSRNNRDSHMVVLDGYPIPNIDPDSFTEFWREREANRKDEQSRKRTISQPRPVSASFAAGSNSLNSNLSGNGLHYPSANGRKNNRRGRPSTAPGGGKRRIRPGSATANLMARMAMAGPGADAYRNNLEKKTRPISSRDHIRRRAAMRRKAAQDFAVKMAEEEKMIQQDTISRVQEANKYAKVLGMKKQYKHLYDKESNLQVEVIENGYSSIVSTAIFHRDHAKLQKHAVASGFFGNKASSGGKKGAEATGRAAEQKNLLRPQQRPRSEILLELKQILADTESLTGVLEGQLMEIEERGWNRGYV
jgi:hypothetical protein